MTTVLTQPHRPQAARRTRQVAASRPRVGPIDDLAIPDVLELISELSVWEDLPPKLMNGRLWAAERILEWLAQYPVDGWQERWRAAGADRDTDWLNVIVAGDPRTATTKRSLMTYGTAGLLLCRAVLPGYQFLGRYRSKTLFQWARQTFRPYLFGRLEQAGAEVGMQPRQLSDGIRAVTRIVLHTGRDVDQLTAEDLHEHREWFYQGLPCAGFGVNAAWDLLQRIGVLDPKVSMRASARLGKRSVEELVDRQGVQHRPIRDILVRYLNERAPAMDYGSLTGLAASLAGRFWADIERHHPGLDTLTLPAEIAEGWKQRLRTFAAPNGDIKPRANYLVILSQVRAFYLDIAEWAMEDPSWAAWAAPSPVRRTELTGMQKARNKTVSEMHQRVRERLPHLARLVDSADAHRRDQADLLATAEKVPIGQTFRHGQMTYKRTLYKSYLGDPSLPHRECVLIEDTATGELIDISAAEDYAFWTWAIIETFRHTGVRVEELMEITHLAIVSYRLPDTGEVVPLLQIIPSKSNEERLLLISPELASVLACTVKRLRDANNGTIPLVTRYDSHEKITGPPLPHLFQRKSRGWQPSVISATQISRMLDDALTRTGLRDAAGQPLRYTPHDFRRMFTTEAVTGGLPVHIAAKLLGHHSMATVESYLAVFQDELVRTYRSFLNKRRALRPETEYREPTDKEWHEFEQHFQKRKLELGECGRPYGTPCQHEHACIRCPMLRVDPRQRSRLTEIISNLADRITEAQMNRWLGEVEGLQVSLHAAKGKLASLDRSVKRIQTLNSSPTDLGIPIIPGQRTKTTS